MMKASRKRILEVVQKQFPNVEEICIRHVYLQKREPGHRDYYSWKVRFIHHPGGQWYGCYPGVPCELVWLFPGKKPWEVIGEEIADWLYKTGGA
jgi:hypothetical protein